MWAPSATGRLSSPHALSLDAAVWLRCSRSSPETVGPSSVLKAEEPKAQAGVGIPYLSDGVSCANLRRLAGGFLRVPLHQIAQALPSGCRPFSLKRPDGSPAVGIAATVRDFDREGVRMCYFVNLQAHATPLTIRVKGAAAVRFDPSTGKRSPVPSVQEEGTLCFSIMLEPHGSAIFFVFEKLHPGHWQGGKRQQPPRPLHLSVHVFRQPGRSSAAISTP